MHSDQCRSVDLYVFHWWMGWMSDWMDEGMWYIHTMEYFYLALKTKALLPYVKTGMNLEGIMVSEISRSQKNNMYCNQSSSYPNQSSSYHSCKVWWISSNNKGRGSWVSTFSFIMVLPINTSLYLTGFLRNIPFLPFFVQSHCSIWKKTCSLIYSKSCNADCYDAKYNIPSCPTNGKMWETWRKGKKAKFCP